MEEKQKFFKLDTQKKYSVLGRSKSLVLFIFLLCFDSVFFAGGIMALLYDITKGKVSEALGVALLFLVFATLFLIFLIRSYLPELKQKRAEKGLLQKGDLTKGVIYNYKCVEVRHRVSNSDSPHYYYKVEFDYQFENFEGKKISHKFKRQLDYEPYLSNHRKVMVCFNDKASIILDDYFISESGEEASRGYRTGDGKLGLPPEDKSPVGKVSRINKEANYKAEPTVSAGALQEPLPDKRKGVRTAKSYSAVSAHDKLYRGLSGKLLRVNPNRKYATKDYSQNYIWAGLACLGLFGTIFLVFLILLLVNIDYSGNKTFFVTFAFPFLIVCLAMLPVLALSFWVLGIGLRKRRKEKRLLADCKFTFGNLLLPQEVYTIRAKHKLTYYFIDDKRERRKGVTVDNVALRTITAKRRVIVAYNDKESMIFDMSPITD